MRDLKLFPPRRPPARVHTPRRSAFLGTSLDGFIARKDGGIDFLEAAGGGATAEEGAEDFGYAVFIARIDALVMGRASFEKVLTFDAWPYERPVFVLTHRPLDVPGRLAGKVEAMSGAPGEVVAALETRGLVRLYIDGGKTVQSFLDAGLLDEITVTRLPVLIGEGIPLFGPLRKDVHLRHVATRAFPGGLVQSTYEIAR